MNNIILLNTLFAEYVAEMNNRCMKIDDIKALERVQQLLSYELPKAEAERENNE